MQKQILILGDLFLDIFEETKSFKISPERPVPVIKPIRTNEFLGGAGNVANNIKSIGGEPFLISKLSSDNNCKKILKLLKEKKILNFININKNYSTPVKKRIVENNHQFLRIDDEKIININNNDEIKIIKFVKKKIKKFDSLIISDYSKGFLTTHLLTEVISIFRKNNKFIFTDPKKNNIKFYKNSNFICPNLNEFKQFLSFERLNYDKKGTLKLLKKSNADFFIITKGSEGITIINKIGEKKNILQEIINVYDVTGAGDSFIAFFAYLFSKKIDLVHCIKISILVCAKIVQKKHTSSLDKEEFQDLIKDYCSSSDIDLNLKVKLWKLVRLKIGIANGCFDVLHSGHLKLIKSAKKKCDKLIILINSDKSVKKLKGTGRPKIKLKNRISFLNMIKEIDQIEEFDDLTPLKKIKQIMPDFLFKGSDYSIKDVVGYKEIKKNGGKVIILKNYKNFSSSKLIK